MLNVIEANRLETAKHLLEPWINESNAPEENRIDVIISVENLLAAVGAIMESKWGYLAAITGLDPGIDSAELEVLYHFCSGPDILTLRVSIYKESAVVPTLCVIIPSAGFFERELSEMFGITIEDAPNSDHLFLPDEWPDGVYPLRKDFQPSA